MDTQLKQWLMEKFAKSENFGGLLSLIKSNPERVRKEFRYAIMFEWPEAYRRDTGRILAAGVDDAEELFSAVKEQYSKELAEITE